MIFKGKTRTEKFKGSLDIKTNTKPLFLFIMESIRVQPLLTCPCPGIWWALEYHDAENHQKPEFPPKSHGLKKENELNI